MLFDLPLNPDLLEQRIGRLDRIGQQNTVEIHVPYLEGTAQQTLLALVSRWSGCVSSRPARRPARCSKAVRDELFELLAANTGSRSPSTPC